MNHKDRRLFDCPACEGSGNRYDSDEYFDDCARCGGSGKIEVEPRVEDDLDCEEDDGLPLGDLPLTDAQERTAYRMEQMFWDHQNGHD